MPIELDAKSIAFLETFFTFKNNPDISDCVTLRDITGVPVNEIVGWFTRRQILERRGRVTVAQASNKRRSQRSDGNEVMMKKTKVARLEDEKTLKSEEETEPTLEELKEQQDRLIRKLNSIAARIVEKMKED